MSLKVFLILAPVAVGGYYVAGRDAGAPVENGQKSATARTASATPRKSPDECRRLEQGLLEESAAEPVADGLGAMRRLHQMTAELRRQGCEPGAANAGRGFQAPVSQMGQAPRPGDPSFEPGRPMVDVGHGAR